jgi:hypothetical protein
LKVYRVYGTNLTHIGTMFSILKVKGMWYK